MTDCINAAGVAVLANVQLALQLHLHSTLCCDPKVKVTHHKLDLDEGAERGGVPVRVCVWQSAQNECHVLFRDMLTGTQTLSQFIFQYKLIDFYMLTP